MLSLCLTLSGLKSYLHLQLQQFSLFTLSPATQTYSPYPVKLWSSSCGKNLSSRLTFENLLTKVLCDKKNTINWLMEKGLIASSMICPHEGCSKIMNLKDEKSAKGGSDGYIWCCRLTLSDQSRHQQYRSVQSGNCFAKSNLMLAEILKLTYYWSHSLSLASQVELVLTGICLLGKSARRL